MSRCTWKPGGGCRKPGVNHRSMRIGQYMLNATLCDEHKDSMVGVAVHAGYAILYADRSNGTRMTIYTAVSGKPFTADDVRRWAVEAGELREDQRHARGRLPGRLIDGFAACH